MRTRFAPSPTGYLHLGGVRTALFNWLLARHHGGEFILRLEDSDAQRSEAESARQILESLTWLGLHSDLEVVQQSQRLELYRERAEHLIAQGWAYRCPLSASDLEQMRAAQSARGEKPRYDGSYRERNYPHTTEPYAIRFKNPLTGAVQFDDLVHGEISVANSELDDLVLIRSDGAPTYNFCCVVDDHEQSISHVVRGDDHLINSARQINIYQAFGYPQPRFAHLPMILGADGSRLSKRHGALSVLEYRDAGVLAPALLNYLARLGWSSGDQEIFSVAELIAAFDFDKIQKSPAAFDPVKLAWVNQQHLQALSLEQLQQNMGTLQLVVDERAALQLHQKRAGNLVELRAQLEYLTGSELDYPPELLDEYRQAAAPLTELLTQLEALSEWEPETLQATIKACARGLGLKMPAVAMPLRVALTASKQSPGINEVCALLGRELTLSRTRGLLAALASQPISS